MPKLNRAPLIQPKGPRLNLQPYGLLILLGGVEDEVETGETKMGGIVVPEGMKKKIDIIREPYRVASVEAVAPDVTGIVKGDRVLVERRAMEQTICDGNAYWFCHIGSVKAVVK